DDKGLREQLRASKAQEREYQSEIDRLSGDREKLQAMLHDRRGKLETEAALRKQCETTLATARKALPEPWPAPADAAGRAEGGRWKAEQRKLEGEGPRAKAGQLEQARVEVQSLRRSRAELEGQRDRFPEEARRDPAEVLAEFERSKADAEARQDQLQKAQRDRSILEERRRRRQELLSDQ